MVIVAVAVRVHLQDRIRAAGREFDEIADRIGQGVVILQQIGDVDLVIFDGCAGEVGDGVDAAAAFVEDEGIVAEAAGEGIAALAAVQDVVARGTGVDADFVFSEDHVIALAAIEFVTARATVESVMAVLAVDRVVAAVAVDRVVARAAEKTIVAGAALDIVLA